MKLKKENIEKFMQTIESCKGPIYLTDWRVNENDEPNFKLNLKSTISLYLGITKLLSEHGDWFEIYANCREDEAKIMKFMIEES